MKAQVIDLAAYRARRQSLAVAWVRFYTWSDMDFCPKCSREILVLIGPALNGIGETLRRRDKR